MNPSIEELTDKYLRCELTQAEIAALEQRISVNDTERAQFRRAARLEANLLAYATGQQSEVKAWTASPPQVEATLAASFRALLWRWFSWRPLTAAVAGIVFGMLCTSVVFAYTQPKSPVVVSKALPLPDGDFESVSQVSALGIPSLAGAWSGDFSRVVVSENGITPKHGQRMLRFLRSDHELSPENERSYVGSAAQVIDLRPLRAGLSGAEQLVEVAAQFNAVALRPGEKYEFAVKAGAYHGDIADGPKLWEDREVSVSRSDRYVIADSDVATWQRVAVSLVVPPEAEFLVIECAVVYKGAQAAQGAAEFPGHYVDQVEVRLSAPATLSFER
ncbi:MAG TPA: hypothetical protein PK529_04300 [Verrucomicrobiales bacterium]|nr:hypothetical protein [Verrucomicrobiales bacterium]